MEMLVGPLIFGLIIAIAVLRIRNASHTVKLITTVANNTTQCMDHLRDRIKTLEDRVNDLDEGRLSDDRQIEDNTSV